MSTNIADIVHVIGSIIGGTVILSGLIGGIWSLCDKWRDRKPRLILFVPHYFTCEDAQSRTPCLMLLARISNSSKQSTFLYLETLGVEIYSEGTWLKLQRLETDQKTSLITDFSDAEKVRFGLNDVKYLNRFGESLVTDNKPVSGYIAAARTDEAVFGQIDKVRISVKDCLLRSYRLEVDLEKQRREHDPTYRAQR